MALRHSAIYQGSYTRTAMARSRRSAPAPARKAPPAPAKAPATTQAAPAPTPVQSSAPSMGGGLLATVAEGMAFGTGSAIARHAVNAAVDSFSGDKEQPAVAAAAPVSAPSAPAVTACAQDNKAFMDCIAVKQNDIASCQFYLDALNQCKQQSAYM